MKRRVEIEAVLKKLGHSNKANSIKSINFKTKRIT